jgi:protein subunit release factor A
MNELELSDIIKKFQFELTGVSNKLQNLDPKKDDKEKKKLLKELNSLNAVIQVVNKYKDVISD